MSREMEQGAVEPESASSMQTSFQQLDKDTEAGQAEETPSKPATSYGRPKKEVVAKRQDADCWETYTHGYWKQFTTMQKIGFVLGPLLSIIFCFVEISDEHPKANDALAGTIFIVVMWICETCPITVTTLMPLVLYPLGSVERAGTLAHQYLNHTSFLTLGAFFVVMAIEDAMAHKRFALWALRYCGTNPKIVLLGFMVITAIVSMFASNTSSTLLMLPVIQGFLEGRIDSPDGRRFEKAALLGVALAATCGGCGTLIGTGANLAFSLLVTGTFPQVTVNFQTWMGFAMPIAIIMVATAWASLTFIYLRGINLNLNTANLQREREELGPVSRDEKVLGLVLFLMVAVWLVTPYAIEPYLGYCSDEQYTNKYDCDAADPANDWDEYVDDSVVAIIGAIALFWIPSSQRPGEMLLDESCFKRLPWGVILLLGAGFAMATAIASSGLSAEVSYVIASATEFSDVALVAIVVVLVAVITELISNVASVTIFSPILFQLAIEKRINPLLLALPATIAASLAFLLPTSTPPMAIAFATGRVTFYDMIKGGMALKIVGMILAIAFPFITGTVFGDLTEFPEWAANSALSGSPCVRGAEPALASQTQYCERLDLSDNPGMGDIAVCKLAESMSEASVRIADLCLDRNARLDDRALCALAKAIRSTNCAGLELEKLSLQHLQGCDMNAFLIRLYGPCAPSEQTPNLIVLDVAYADSCLNTAAMESLFAKPSIRLQKLVMSGNRLDAQAGASLCQALANLDHEEAVQLRNALQPFVANDWALDQGAALDTAQAPRRLDLQVSDSEDEAYLGAFEDDLEAGNSKDYDDDKNDDDYVEPGGEKAPAKDKRDIYNNNNDNEDDEEEEDDNQGEITLADLIARRKNERKSKTAAKKRRKRRLVRPRHASDAASDSSDSSVHLQRMNFSKARTRIIVSSSDEEQYEEDFDHRGAGFPQSPPSPRAPSFASNSASEAEEEEEEGEEGGVRDEDMDLDCDFLRGWDDEELAARPHSMSEEMYHKLMSLGKKKALRQVSKIQSRLDRELADLEKRLRGSLGTQQLKELHGHLRRRLQGDLLDVTRVLLKRLESLRISELHLLPVDAAYRNQDERVSALEKRLRRLLESTFEESSSGEDGDHSRSNGESDDNDNDDDGDESDVSVINVDMAEPFLQNVDETTTQTANARSAPSDAFAEIYVSATDDPPKSFSVETENTNSANRSEVATADLSSSGVWILVNDLLKLSPMAPGPKTQEFVAKWKDVLDSLPCVSDMCDLLIGRITLLATATGSRLPEDMLNRLFPSLQEIAEHEDSAAHNKFFKPGPGIPLFGPNARADDVDEHNYRQESQDKEEDEDEDGGDGEGEDDLLETPFSDLVRMQLEMYKADATKHTRHILGLLQSFPQVTQPRMGPRRLRNYAAVLVAISHSCESEQIMDKLFGQLQGLKRPSDCSRREICLLLEATSAIVERGRTLVEKGKGVAPCKQARRFLEDLASTCISNQNLHGLGEICIQRMAALPQEPLTEAAESMNRIFRMVLYSGNIQPKLFVAILRLGKAVLAAAAKPLESFTFVQDHAPFPSPLSDEKPEQQGASLSESAPATASIEDMFEFVMQKEEAFIAQGQARRTRNDLVRSLAQEYTQFRQRMHTNLAVTRGLTALATASAPHLKMLLAAAKARPRALLCYIIGSFAGLSVRYSKSSASARQALDAILRTQSIDARTVTALMDSMHRFGCLDAFVLESYADVFVRVWLTAVADKRECDIHLFAQRLAAFGMLLVQMKPQNLAICVAAALQGKRSAYMEQAAAGIRAWWAQQTSNRDAARRQINDFLLQIVRDTEPSPHASAKFAGFLDVLGPADVFRLPSVAPSQNALDQMIRKHIRIVGDLELAVACIHQASNNDRVDLLRHLVVRFALLWQSDKEYEALRDIRRARREIETLAAQNEAVAAMHDRLVILDAQTL
ncbi:Solute carrier family 13 member 5 [Hondaea fermentalgiana]|uniref:Solute carrier family 13 member 5 n=1 Tax=Hondaea fermentalgiana TaxID=2315210 RepID=A0A2R5G5U3_9STRA|nr:Solute carrier family 13 member 5 [Hondaea fermentalgiana]|eukprot:GBG26406.1 Solute carrier family 13 member 5 [Hondaea fermentalgiana]